MPPPNTPEEGVPVSSAHTRRPESQQTPRTRQSQPSSRGTSPSSSRPSSAGSTSIRSSSIRSTCILQFDYQSLEYKETVDDTLVCPICCTPFYEPITTKNCGHTFCAACLRRATDIQPVCPIDRQPLSFHSDQLCNTRIISHQLDRLKVKCPNLPCEYVTTRGLVPAHYERYCEHTPVHCPDVACDKRVPRMDATLEKGCLHRDIQCRYCKATVLVADLEEHYDTDCSGHTAKCPHCNAMVVRHRLPSHIARDCPETEMRCKWHPFGCTLFTKKRVVDQHEQNGCIYQAIGQLARDRMDDRMIINELKGRLTTAESRMRRMESSAGSRPQVSPPGLQGWRFNGTTGIPELDLNGDHPHGAHPSAYGGGNEDSSGWESPEDYMLAQFERMETKIEDLRKTVTELDGRHSVMLLNEAMPLKEQIAELRSNMGVIGMHTTWLMNVQRQSRGQQQQQRANGPAGMAARNGTSPSSSAGSRGDAEPSEGSHHYGPGRRMSDGRGENPPRL